MEERQLHLYSTLKEYTSKKRMVIRHLHIKSINNPNELGLQAMCLNHLYDGRELQ